MVALPLRIVAIAATALALAACATAPGAQGPAADGSAAAPAASLGNRDLTAQEKKAITEAVAPSLRDPASAKYHWAKFPVMTSDNSVNYCAWVVAKSPYPAYNGRQDYIVEATMSGNHVSSAVMGLIAGGKDAELVRKMCEKYGLDPNNAS